MKKRKERKKIRVLVAYTTILQLFLVVAARAGVLTHSREFQSIYNVNNIVYTAGPRYLLCTIVFKNLI